MRKGTVRQLMTDRGFGFIRTEGKEDLFFHRSQLQGVDYNALRVGQQVEFEIGQGRNGRQQALRVGLPQLSESKRKNEELNPRSEAIEDGPIWKEAPFLFGILLFPGILLLCFIIYLIQSFIMK
jgi:CspA family cold shock protein